MISLLIHSWYNSLISNRYKLTAFFYSRYPGPIHLLLFFFFYVISPLLLSQSSITYAEVVDRILAVVNKEIISLSDLNRYIVSHPKLKDSFQSMVSKDREKEIRIFHREVLERMIDEKLLLLEAQRLNLEIEEPAELHSSSYDQLLIQGFINQRIRSFIFIPPHEIERYYKEYRDRFKGKDLEDVYDMINNLLIEEKTSERLREYLKRLRVKAVIRINLY